MHDARRRLIFDELLLLQLAVHLKRAHLRRTLHAPALRWSQAIDEHIRARIPFSLTQGQDAAVDEIKTDLQQSVPASRLIQGDVGSGKTAVAVYAMLMAVASGHQAAIMAPTELLAEQHYLSISDMLRDSNVRIGLLTGSLRDSERRDLLDKVAGGDVDVVIGTHALLTEDVAFSSLGVAVIDEQHRFGVHQRARLRERVGDESSMPHVLVMTATPIPRTLALTVFGDLDVSIVSGQPPGRGQISTRLVSPAQRDEVYGFVRQRVDAGDQVYVVVPSIEGGDAADVRSTIEALEVGPLAGRRVAGLHGRLKRETRANVMERFRSGAIDVLVATTVIEVGIDVPSATVMVVEQAERFGLAQLHQLRGRVGRGERDSVCVLIGEAVTGEAKARLEAMASISDGFVLAEKDLEIRGPGEIVGAKQSGAAPFRLAEFPRDIDLLLAARRDAATWIERSPDLGSAGESLLRRRLMKAHGEALGIADVA